MAEECFSDVTSKSTPFKCRCQAPFTTPGEKVVLYKCFAPTFRNAGANRKPTVAPIHTHRMSLSKELERQVNAILIMYNHSPNTVSVVGLS